MKFNKDTFLNDITDKVQSAIDKNLITNEDVDSNNLERLHGFIKYALAELIEDRKFALDVLKDFNYDEKTPWDSLQDKYGVFKSLMDIALVNLWKFLQSEGCTEYKYYKYDNRQNGSMLDVIRDDYEDEDENHNSYDSFDRGFDDYGDEDNENSNEEDDDRGFNDEESQPKRRKLRVPSR